MNRERNRSHIIDPQTEPDLARREAFLLPGVVNESTHLLRTNRRHNYYLDIDPILANPVECERVVQWFAGLIWRIRAEHRESPLDMLAFIEKDRDSGGTVGVLQIAGAISIATQTPYVVVRLGKELPSERIKYGRSHSGWKFEPPLNSRFSGRTFAVLTDHCTGGDEVFRASSVITDNGGKVSDVLAYSIIAPEFQWALFQQRGIRVHHFLQAPADLEGYRPRLGFELKQW